MKNLICLLLVAFLATATFAQQKGMAQKIDASVERMTRELDLTADQQTKVKEIYEKKIANKKNRKAQTREEYRAAHAGFDQQIEAVLTPEQIAKRKTLKENHKKEMRTDRTKNKVSAKGSQRGKKGKGSQRMAKMSPEMIENRAVKSTEKLNRQVNLTEAQEVKVKEAYLAFFQRNQAIANDASQDAAAKKELLSQLKKDHRADIKAILTPEQLAARKANKKTKKVNKKQKQQH